jgi:hypothetical protein
MDREDDSSNGGERVVAQRAPLSVLCREHYGLVALSG